MTFGGVLTVKKVLTRIQQQTPIKGSTEHVRTRCGLPQEGVAYLKTQKNEYTESVGACLKDRVKLQHISEVESEG